MLSHRVNTSVADAADSLLVQIEPQLSSVLSTVALPGLSSPVGSVVSILPIDSLPVGL